MFERYLPTGADIMGRLYPSLDAENAGFTLNTWMWCQKNILSHATSFVTTHWWYTNTALTVWYIKVVSLWPPSQEHKKGPQKKKTVPQLSKHDNTCFLACVCSQRPQSYVSSRSWSLHIEIRWNLEMVAPFSCHLEGVCMGGRKEEISGAKVRVAGVFLDSTVPFLWNQTI